MKLFILSFFAIIMAVSCQQYEEVNLLNNAQTQLEDIYGLEEQSDGYFLTDGKFGFSTVKALCGEKISVTLNASFNFRGPVDKSAADAQDIKSLAGTEWDIFGSIGKEEKYHYKFGEDGKFWISFGIDGEPYEGTFEQAGERVYLSLKDSKWEGSYDGSEFTVGDSTNRISLLIGENLLVISDAVSEVSEPGIYLRGPSINWTEELGVLSDYFTPGTPFELTVTYDGSTIAYAVDGKEIYSNDTEVSPEGTIRVEGYSKGLKIYDLKTTGEYKSVEELYTKEFMLGRADKSTAAAAEKVKDDPNRPAFHFQPPANWNNDPNGMMYYDGYYHMFYQYNPYGDIWDWMHWGHARSRDMVFWEHLPVALWPSLERGEQHCFSGSGFIMDNGDPIIFYTSIGHENPEHWAAVPTDDQLIDWVKHPDNPLIVMEDHGGEIIDSWRDPFLFREAGGTYMVIGGHPRGAKGSIMMYKALNSELTKWEYIGSPFEGQENNWECPNFFKVDDKYVLIYSPHGQVEYYTGTLDIENVKFISEYHGLVDNGSDWNYYAPNALQKDDGRRILFGWIPGFKKKQGWQGAVSLPRELSVDSKGRLIQTPVEEINKLRGDLESLKNVTVFNRPEKVDVKYPQFDMEIKIKGDGANNVGFRFNDESGKPYEIIVTSQNMFFGEEQVAVDPVMNEKIKNVRFIFDRTIVEIYVNNGLIAATEVVYPDKENFDFQIFSTREKVKIESLDIWEIESIWKK